jgi:cytoskeletal protein CcmA (bactofilin family)
LTVGPNGRVVADINVRDLVVFGNIKGNIHASGRIDLRQTAAVQGDVFASRLSIEEDATIQGRVELLAQAATAPSPASTTAPAVQTSLPDIKA